MTDQRISLGVFPSDWRELHVEIRGITPLLMPAIGTLSSRLTRFLGPRQDEAYYQDAQCRWADPWLDKLTPKTLTMQAMASLQFDRGTATRKVTEMAKQKVQEISIPVPDMRVLNVVVMGTSPLICHKWSTKAQQQIKDKQDKKAKAGRDIRDPEAEFRATLYELNGRDKYGFPASAFKHAMVGACRFCEGITMTFAKGAFFVMGDLLEIKGCKPKMVTHMVRVPPGPKGRADIRYRGQFDTWSIPLSIKYNANVVSAEQVLNLLALAGVSIGIGETRPGAPEKPGTNGMWEVQGAKRARKAV